MAPPRRRCGPSMVVPAGLSLFLLAATLTKTNAESTSVANPLYSKVLQSASHPDGIAANKMTIHSNGSIEATLPYMCRPQGVEPSPSFDPHAHGLFVDAAAAACESGSSCTVDTTVIGSKTLVYRSTAAGSSAATAGHTLSLTVDVRCPPGTNHVFPSVEPKGSNGIKRCSDCQSRKVSSELQAHTWSADLASRDTKMYKVTEDGKRVTAQSEEVLNLLSVVAFDDQRKCSFPQNGTTAIPVNSRTSGPKSGTFRSGTAGGGSTAGAQGSCSRVPWRKRSAKVPTSIRKWCLTPRRIWWCTWIPWTLDLTRQTPASASRSTVVLPMPPARAKTC